MAVCACVWATDIPGRPGMTWTSSERFPTLLAPNSHIVVDANLTCEVAVNMNRPEFSGDSLVWFSHAASG
jgi:hypothetical protein